MDYSTGTFNENARGIVDYGFDMYAPQTFAQKPVVTGWLNMWDRNVPSEKYGFAGMLTAPREVSVKDGRLFQEPRVSSSVSYSTEVSNTLSDNVKIGVVTVKAKGLEELTLKMRSNGTSFTSLVLSNGEWVLDRSKSGESIVGVEKDPDSLSGIRRMPCSKKDEITLTLVMDEFSIEIFEDGRALSSTVYPPDNADGLELTVKADSCVYERADVTLTA